MNHPPPPQSLSETTCHKDPFSQFNHWFEEAKDFPVELPEAVNLATVGKEGKPAARMVLLKYVYEGTFVFFTNLNSRKAHEIKHSPYGAMTFFWPGMQRQIRIEGKIVSAPPELSDRYFSQRPEGSRISAWISPQSQEIPSREVLETAHSAFGKKNKHQLSTRPPFWGGYALIPQRIEFWQGREDRLHDRILYVKENGSSWKIKRLAP